MAAEPTGCTGRGGPPVGRDAKGEAMFWWTLMVGLVAVFVVITVVENRRGSKGAASAEDRHLDTPDRRNDGTGWGAGSGGG